MGAFMYFNPSSANPAKWSNTLRIRRQKPTNCLSVFDHFVRMVPKGLRSYLFVIGFSPNIFAVAD